MSATAATAGGAAGWLRAAFNNASLALATLARTPRPGPTPRWRTRPRVAIGIVTTVAVLAALMLFVDARLMAALRGLPVWFVILTEQVTDLGRSGWFLFPLAAMLVIIAMVSAKAPPAAQRMLASLAVRCGFLFTAIAVPGLVGTLAKRMIGRSRPQTFAVFNPFEYWPMAWRSEYASLPSGHANTVFASLVAVGALWPALRPLMWVYAVLVALSRLVLFAHFPSDVVAGAVLGAVGALLVRDWFAVRRLGFTVLADGTVRPFPGLSWARIKKVAGRLRAP